MLIKTRLKPRLSGSPLIPQIKSTALNILMILFAAPLAYVFYAYTANQIHVWADVPAILNRGVFGAVMMAIGWLLMKSPFSTRITELLSTKTLASGAQETTEMKITESNPPPPASVIEVSALDAKTLMDQAAKPQAKP
jgi:hypothetical protein